MSQRPIESVLGLLKGVRPNGTGWTALCPAHDDHARSLSVAVGNDGKVLLRCHAGCDTNAILAALNIGWSDLFLQATGIPAADGPRPITVAELASAKALPLDFLRELGLENQPGGILIPYRTADGSPADRSRLRTALRAKEGSFWSPKKGAAPGAYGLWRLDEARKAGYLVLVEGESDSWTLWHHGFPCLGIPGADMAGKLEANHLLGISRIYIVREPDKGGDAFVRGTLARLRALGWNGEVFVVRLEGAKDPNELHVTDPVAFPGLFRQALVHAEPVGHDATTDSNATSIADLTVASVLGSLGTDTSPGDLERALRELAAKLAGSDPLRRRIARDSAITVLKQAGISAPAAMVDAALSINAAVRVDELQGHAVTSSTPQPWPEPVDEAVLLDSLVGTFNRYLVLPEHAAEALALWVLHAYAVDMLFLTPILAVISPTKRCGKSTVLDLLAALVPRRLLASNITAAAVFRTIEQYKPTLLIDEADTFLPNNEDLRGVLNSGHTRTTAVVVRTVGDNHEPRTFSTFCAKVVALIGKLPPTLDDRSIVIPMRRKSRVEKRERLRRDRIDDAMEPLRQQAIRWVSDHLDQIKEADPALPEQLHDRAQDNWRPLVAIADLAGDHWPQLARSAALVLTGASEEADGTPGIQLLADLQDLFRERGTNRLASKEIVEALCQMVERPWPEWRKGRPLSENQLARLLRAFGIKPKTIRIGSATPKGYELGWLEDAFSRYLSPSDPPHPQQANVGANLDEFSNRNTMPSVADQNRDLSVDEQRDVAGVAVGTAGSVRDQGSSPPHGPLPEGWDRYKI